jgi:hypothetical protein
MESLRRSRVTVPDSWPLAGEFDLAILLPRFSHSQKCLPKKQATV